MNSDRTLLLHSALCLAALTAAFWTWTRPDTTHASLQPTLIDRQKANLTEIVWHDKQWNVRLMAPDDSSDKPMVEVTVADASGAPRVRRMRASKNAGLLLQNFIPLHGSRSLGQPETNSLEPFGLVNPDTTLTARFSDETSVRLLIGGSTYGDNDSYVQASDGGLYLVPQSLLNVFRHGARGLQDLRIVGIDREAISRVVITDADGRQRTVLQRLAEDAQKAFFAEPAEPDKRLPRIAEWLDRILQLNDAGIDVDEQATTTGPPAFVVEFYTQRADKDPVVASFWSGADQLGVVRVSGVPKAYAVSQSEVAGLLRDLGGLWEPAEP